jgi:hypothetical protein
VFDYNLYNEAGSTFITAADLVAMRINYGTGYDSPANHGLTVSQDVPGELVITGYPSALAASTAQTNGIQFEQGLSTGEPYSAPDVVVTANTTGNTIKGLHVLETGRTLHNTPQPGIPIAPTRQLFPVSG